MLPVIDGGKNCEIVKACLTKYLHAALVPRGKVQNSRFYSQKSLPLIHLQYFKTTQDKTNMADINTQQTVIHQNDSESKQTSQSELAHEKDRILTERKLNFQVQSG